ncbi:segregation/condensation protein A [Martelella alba]|uniref:Segregation and condensation protein A n=1 Tax=Martelella alba TaxID=2590451 RepID=A0A506UKB1_9HYPH|nr:ScpA family protein [Martelella alba]TPW33662.1 segregation/condensation protein A [Martelella alba]
MQEHFFPELDDEGNGLPSEDERLVIDVGGFEGPLDLLLHLARAQKVDLARISVLALAEQYLQFIEKARQIRLELAADYLVMAAWLAYLKSRLLIPRRDKDDEPSGEDMAATLAFRLKRLEAMRDAAASLVNRNRLGRDVFARGQPEHIPDDGEARFGATLYDLLSAYSGLRQRQTVSEVTIARRTVWSLTEARELLTEMVGDIADWTALDRFLLRYLAKPEDMRTAIASTFAASLELVREGRLALRQDAAFAPILMRRGAGRTAPPPEDNGSSGDDE